MFSRLGPLVAIGLLAWLSGPSRLAAAPPPAILMGELAPPGLEAFTKVRQRWSEEKYIQPYWEMAGGRNVIFDRYQAGDFAAVVQRAPPWLRRFPIDVPVHYMLANSYRELGNYLGYSVHMHWYRGLIASVLASGDGTAPASAMKVVALREEYFVVRDLGGTVKTQELVEVAGRAFHKVTMERGATLTTLYFDISVPLSQMSNAFPARAPANPPAS